MEPTTDVIKSYQELKARLREISLAGSAASLLSWDQETYMPPKALVHRADQLAFLTGWTHRRFTAPEVGAWIKACEDHGFDPAGVEGVNVREWRRQYDRQTRVPPELVEEFERVKTHAREAWVQARKASEFSRFQPHLTRIIEINRQLADCWGYKESPYDALLDEFEPGVQASQLRELFSRLKPAIVELVGPATERSAAIPENYLEDDYPIAAQQAFNREVAAAVGFDFEAGRIDTTAHPFCTGLGPGDCRLTTRYHERNFTQSLYGVLHEVGHGLYDQGLLPEHFGTPMGSAVSLGIHESQSRLWENHVGRSLAFWEYWHGKACRHFPGLKRFSPHQLHAAVNRVSPSFIRVEADQVTYDLHIILRFEIEVKLIEGALKAAEVPAYWNEAFEAMLGLKVPDDARGCLQDIHWSLGGLGYFPTYTLGNLNAAQLFKTALAEIPDGREALREGQYQPLLTWLRRKIHEQGNRYRPRDLMVFATGAPTQAEHHLSYLKGI
jgi:carboxypeptidase Taq